MFIEPFCMQYFGKRLKEIRKKSGLSQETLAKELGVSKGALCYYENGERTPDIEFLEKVSVYYNIPANYFMGFTDAMNPKNSSIVDRTGLSEETVEILMEDHEEGYISNVLDKLIRNDNFRFVLSLIECESHSSSNNWDGTDFFSHSFGIEYKRLSPSYSVYILEKLLMEAIFSVLDDRHGEIITGIYNSLLSKQEQEEFFKWALSPKKPDELDERIKQLDRETQEKTEKNILRWKKEDATRENALERLHSSNQPDGSKPKGSD